MKALQRYIKTSLAVGTLALGACVHETVIPGAGVQVQVLQTDIALGSTVNVKFTNTGSVDVYLQSKCASMKRRYDSEWRTPESLMPLTTCAKESLSMRLVSPGQSVTEQVRMWATTTLTTDLTGEFKLSYVFAETEDPHAPRFQTSTTPFTVK